MVKTISKSIFAILFFLILINTAHAQSYQKVADAVLWEITGKDLQKKSWIFGTLHMICPEDFYVFPGVEEALKQAGKIVVELDITDPEVTEEIRQSMIMGEGQRFEDLFDEDDYRRVKNFFKDSIGVNLETLSQVQPIFLSSMIYPRMIGCTPKSYEDYLVRKATDYDIPVRGLEEVDEQFSVFRHLSYEQQATLLMEYIEEYDQKKSEFNIMVSDYLNQSINKLLEDIKSSSYDEIERFTREMMEERNKIWIPRIEDLINEQSVFIGIGAGHLPGEEGVIKLLRDRGYDVNPVMQ